MKPENCILFLQNKIQGIGSALFHSLSDAVMKLPTSIVTTLRVDDDGYVWFLINRPEQRLETFDLEFPARLQFYRKGKDYHLQIAGKATIINDPEELYGIIGLPEEIKTRAFVDMVLVKVKIEHAKYYEYNNRALPKNNFRRVISGVYNWLFSSAVKSDHLVLQPSPRLGF